MNATKAKLSEILAIVNSEDGTLSERRLVAADLADDADLSDMAAALRRTDQPVLFWLADPEHPLPGARARLTSLASPLPLGGVDLVKKIKKVVSSKKRSVALSVSTSVEMYENYHDGGTGYDYVVIEMPILDTAVLARYMAGAGNPMRPLRTHTLQPGTVMVKTGLFCGKEVSPDIFIHPSDAASFGLGYIPKDDSLAREMARLEKVTRAAVVKVWNYIQGDAAELMEGLNRRECIDVAVELCLDADRPVAHGGMDKEDYDAVMKLEHRVTEDWARQELAPWF